MTMLVVICLVTNPVLAECLDKAKCEAAIAAADEVIDKQSNLLVKLTQIHEEDKDENERLSAALVEMTKQNEQNVDKNIKWGLAGFAAGAFTILFAVSKLNGPR